MGRNRDTPPTTVAQFVALKREGLSQRAIARRFEVSQSVVQRCLARYGATGSFNARKRPNRNRVTSVRTDMMIRRLVKKNPTVSSTEIRSALPTTDVVSTRTIRRRLSNEMGLKSYKAAAKPLLSPKNIADRLQFCKRYKDWTAEDWHHVVFSDESTIRQFSNASKTVRRPPGERYNPRYTTPAVKHPNSVMIWGSISARGRGGLWIMPPGTTINADVYLSILQEKLPIFMDIHNCSIFQHDGAPCHSARKVKRWLVEQGITLLEKWPGNSPDLNPIEHCWVIVKRKVHELKPTCTADMVEKIKQVWCQQITIDFCKKLVESMPERIRAVLSAKGKSTRF